MEEMKHLFRRVFKKASSGKSVLSAWFVTYEDALASCGGKGYAAEELANVVVEKNVNFRKNLQSGAAIPVDSLRVLTGIASMSPTPILRVLDFGGAGGNHYSIARMALGADRDIRWNVVETEPMVRVANRKLAGNGLKFFDNIAHAASDLDQIDLVFSSGALQYTPDPLASLSMLLELRARYLFITRTGLNTVDKKIITLQRSRLSDNGPGSLPPGFVDCEIVYPITFIGKATVEQLISERYSIRYSIDEGQAYRHQGPQFHMCGYFCELNDIGI